MHDAQSPEQELIGFLFLILTRAMIMRTINTIITATVGKFIFYLLHTIK